MAKRPRDHLRLRPTEAPAYAGTFVASNLQLHDRAAAMNTIAVLAVVLVIYLFGGYADPPNESGPLAAITMNDTRSIAEWRVSLWLAVLSPFIGILIGLLCLVLFAR